MKAQNAALAFKAWAQQNRLLGSEFPARLDVSEEDRDSLFDSLQVTAASEGILRSRHITAVAFSETADEVLVFTSKKITQRDEKLLPQIFGDDVKVRYLNGGTASAGTPTGTFVNSAYAITPGGHYASGGSIFPARHIGAGTLGCLTRDSVGTLFGLTNNHVSGMCNYSRTGEKILAPGHLDIEANGLDPFTIGFHAMSLPMVSGVPDNVDILLNSDAALIQITDPNRVSSFQGTHYDTPSLVAELQAGQQVEKVGRTTGLTSGKVVAQMAGPFPVIYQVPSVGAQIAYFEPVFVVQGNSGPFSQNGDSGSLVTADVGGTRMAVGVIFAGDQAGSSFVLPLAPILATLGVTIVSGHNV
jgi:hypothetical protein